MNTLCTTVEAEIADIMGLAKSMGYTARSVLTVARHRVAIAAGRKPRTPTSDVTRLYLDALEGRNGLGRGIAVARLREMVERLEVLLRRQTGDTAGRAMLVGDIPEGDDILQCDIPAASEPAQPKVVAVPLAPMGAVPVTVLEVAALDMEIVGPDGRPVRPVLVIAIDPDGRLAKAGAGNAQVVRAVPSPNRFDPTQRGKFERTVRRYAATLVEILTETVNEGQHIPKAFLAEAVIKRTQDRQARLAPLQAYKKRELTDELRRELEPEIRALVAGGRYPGGCEPPEPT